MQKFRGSAISIPGKIMDDVVTASAEESHAMAIKTDGSLWAWGRNNWGQLGNGTQEDIATLVKIIDDVVIKTDGSLWAFGRNDYGQISNGTGESTGSSIYSIPCKDHGCCYCCFGWS